MKRFVLNLLFVLLCLGILSPLLWADLALFGFYGRGARTVEELRQFPMNYVWEKAIYDLKEVAEAHPEWEIGTIWDGNGKSYAPENRGVIYVNYMTPEQEYLLLKHYDLDPRLRLERAEENIIEE